MLRRFNAGMNRQLCGGAADRGPDSNLQQARPCWCERVWKASEERKSATVFTITFDIHATEYSSFAGAPVRLCGFNTLVSNNGLIQGDSVIQSKNFICKLHS